MVDKVASYSIRGSEGDGTLYGGTSTVVLSSLKTSTL